MQKIYLIFVFFCVLGTKVNSQIVLFTSGTYSQDFNTLVTTGNDTASNLPTGWLMTETGTAANQRYTAGTGSSTSGDTYSFGATGNTDRAFGSLQSGSLVPTIGARFLNNSGGNINTITFTYTGEQWRCGATGRQDRLDFQYATAATSLTDAAGNWADVNSLDFNTPNTTGPVGLLDGNAAANRTTGITFTLTALSIPNGSTFYIRWQDFNPSGSDDGLSIDDFTMTYTFSGVGDVTPPSLVSLSPAHLSTNVPANPNCAINFDEGIKRGTGSLLVKELAGNTVVATIPVASTTVTSNTASFTITGLLPNTTYYVEIPFGAFTDSANNNCPTLGGPAGWQFTTFATQPVAYNFPFTTCTAALTEGFTQFSVTGPQTWGCTTFGFNPSNGVQMNGFVSGPGNITNEDWLISPQLDLTGFNIPLLKFQAINRFAGPQLQLRVSTNYPGYGNPNLATWTTINGRFPEENTNVWTLCDSINLSAFKTGTTYIAWVYNSTTAAAARWTLDEIQLFNSAVVPGAFVSMAPLSADFGYIPLGSSSFWKPFTFNASDLTADLVLNAPVGFEISKDSAVASSSISYTPAQAQPGTKTFYARFTPHVADAAVIDGNIGISSTGLNQPKSKLSGTSLSKDKTLEVVNWNLDWFGKEEIPVTDPGPWGPLNEDVQERNAKAIIKTLDADVYAFQEIVDTTRFKRLIDTLGGLTQWGYAFSDFCSGATAPTDPFYAGGQKLGFIYRKAVVSNVSTRGMLRTSSNYDSTYKYWSSGRFPYLMRADVTLGSITQPVDFIVIHAKANTGTDAEKIDSYRRRKLGLQELKDTLDAGFSNNNIILLGDFNDDLDKTIAPITSGPDTVSSYSYMIADSIDADSYKSITLPLSLQNLRSTVSNTNVIDHQVISNEMNVFYMPGTASVRTEVVGIVAPTPILYADSTTDHYPVYSRFNFLQAPVPVKLISFTAQKAGNAVKLQWATTQEVNSKYFEVQRSAGGGNWVTIATINAAGNSTITKSYETMDYTPAKGINLYRLRQVDIDEKFDYSVTRSVLFSSTYQAIVAPNPATEYIQVYVAKDNINPYTVQLLDMSGRVLKTTTTVQPVTRFATATLTKGVYTVRITDSDNTTIKKVSVQ
jgi:hypothetical protein